MKSFEYKALKELDRRLGGVSNREILVVPGCVIPSLGLWTSISPPGVPRALVGLVFDFVAK